MSTPDWKKAEKRKLAHISVKHKPEVNDQTLALNHRAVTEEQMHVLEGHAAEILPPRYFVWVA